MMPLQLATGHASLQGVRECNEDFCGIVTPGAAELEARGALLALADGVSGNGGGREAAEYTVRGLLADYYATPDTWGVHFALDKVLNAHNRWLLAQTTQPSGQHGKATTLTALILRGRRYYLTHIGDSRAYLLRNGRLAQLTSDHVWDHPEMRHVLTRAVGLDPHLAMDYADGELQNGDVFLLLSDGVWEPLGHQRLQQILLQHSDPQRAAEQLTQAALGAGGQDNASAVVARIDAVPAENLPDSLAQALHLPLPQRLKPGERIDDFEVLEVLHESRATLLYKVQAITEGSVQVLKTLQPHLHNDRESCEGLLVEEWLAKRIVSHYFSQIVPLPVAARNYLYYVMIYHQGATLQQHLDSGRHFSVAETVQCGIRILKGLGALHRLSIIHRDIKPANLHAGEDGRLRILDLGVALAAGLPHTEAQGNPGTPSYMAPELLQGEAASPQSDLYATGVSLYHLLTRKYPYGEIEPFQHPKFAEPAPPTRTRPDIPRWLENILLKAVAHDPANRFETAEEFLLALQKGDAVPLVHVPHTPLAARDPRFLWRSIALVAMVLNLLLIYLLLVR
ncbi:MAG: protein kinase domain-containing protein [Burkholderiales bacterium]